MPHVGAFLALNSVSPPPSPAAAALFLFSPCSICSLFLKDTWVLDSHDPSSSPSFAALSPGAPAEKSSPSPVVVVRAVASSSSSESRSSSSS